jgi:hypothetical protein
MKRAMTCTVGFTLPLTFMLEDGELLISAISRALVGWGEGDSYM